MARACRAAVLCTLTFFFVFGVTCCYKAKGSTIIIAGMGGGSGGSGGGGYGDDGYVDMNEMPVVITKKGKIAFMEDMMMSSMKKRKKKKKKKHKMMEEEEMEFDDNYGYTPVRKECMVVCKKKMPQPEMPADMEWDTADPY